MYQLIVFLSAAILTALLMLLLRGRQTLRLNILKGLVVLFCTVGFVRLFLSDSFLYVINGGWFGEKYLETTDVLQSILRWGYYTNYAVLPVAVFCKCRFVRNVAGYFSLPFSILSTVYFEDFMAYFLSPKGLGYHTPEGFRYVFFAAELVLAIVIPLTLHISERHVFNFKSLAEWRNFFLGLPLLILLMTPAYIPQSFLGYDYQIPAWYGTYHFAWLGILLAAILMLYYFFRFRDYNTRYALCLFLALVLFFHYNSLYLMGVTLKRLPFQLCNIAAYFYLIAIIFKMKRMFQFCFIANMVGTLFAILLPDFSIGNFGFWNAHFIFEHSLVLMVPALAMGLRVFPRINKKSLGYFFIGYTSYFLFSFVVGTILNGYSDITGETVNYFYMFDLKTAYDYFPFLTFTQNYHFTFGRFEVYPLVVLICYLGFAALCLLFCLPIRLFYKLEDDHLALRGSAIDLYEKITKKKSWRPKHFID